jgi:hypothetical protein
VWLLPHLHPARPPSGSSSTSELAVALAHASLSLFSSRRQRSAPGRARDTFFCSLFSAVRHGAHKSPQRPRGRSLPALPRAIVRTRVNAFRQPSLGGFMLSYMRSLTRLAPAISSSHKIRHVPPGCRGPDHTGDVGTQYLRLHRAPPGSAGPGPGQLRRVHRLPHPTADLQLWDLQLLSKDHWPACPQRCPDPQAAPALLADAGRKRYR